METLSDSIISVNPTPKQKPSFEPVGTLTREAGIILRIGRRGIVSIQILADESEAEDYLLEVFKTVRPLLKLLHETVTSLKHEPVEARS